MTESDLLRACRFVDEPSTGVPLVVHGEIRELRGEVLELRRELGTVRELLELLAAVLLDVELGPEPAQDGPGRPEPGPVA